MGHHQCNTIYQTNNREERGRAGREREREIERVCKLTEITACTICIPETMADNIRSKGQGKRKVIRREVKRSRLTSQMIS